MAAMARVSSPRTVMTLPLKSCRCTWIIFRNRVSISNGWPANWLSFSRSMANFLFCCTSVSVGTVTSSRGSNWSTGTL